MLGRSVAWVAIVALILIWLSRPLLPAWFLALVVAAAVVLGVLASTRQKRLERDVVRGWWRNRTR